MELLESGLRVPFVPGAAFAACRSAPASEYSAMVGAVFFWSASALLLGGFAAMTQSSADIGMTALLVVVGAGSVLAVPLSFVAAGCLHLLAVLSGGRSDFDRSYQTLTLLGAVAPVSALLLCSPIPLLGLVPTAYATFLAVRGLEVLHDAPGMQAWFVVGAFGGLMGAAQVLLHGNIARFERELSHRVNLYYTGGAKAATAQAQEPPLEAEVQTPPAPAPAPTPNPYSPDRLAPQQPERRSSLDMVRQEGEGGGLPDGPGDGYPIGGGGALPQAPGPGSGSFQGLGLGLLGTIQQKIASDPNALKGLPQEQRDKFMQMLSAASRFSAASQRGEKVSPQDQAAMQKMIQEMMSGMGQMQKQAQQTGGSSPKPRKKKAEPADDLLQQDDGLGQ